MKPTAEQAAARDVFAAGHDLALVAGAGTGKTTALILMGEATNKRGLYIAFNKSIADEAARRFRSNVECRTSHSLAFSAEGRPYQERLRTQARIPAKETARVLGIVRDLNLAPHCVKVNHQARLVMGMLRRFCYSTDRRVMARHMERVNGLDPAAQEHLAGTLLPYAIRAWDDICSPQGHLRFEHDHYMKIWALTAPTLEADFVLLDEAQDTNPVLEEIFLNQRAQRVCVGDPAQQIYGWRNARDVMTGFPAESLQLTQCFRFGPEIAAVANRWLRHAGSAMRLVGCGPPGRVETVPDPDVVLCRGNADAMQEVLAFLEQDVPVALTGGGDAMLRVARAAEELKSGRRTSHPELFLFTSWEEVQDYVEHDTAGQDLRAIVKIIDKYGPDKIAHAVSRLSDEQHAKVAVSTVHKAKGREWGSVRIGGGFESPSVDDDGAQQALDPSEARLIYVAVTRARRRLDLRGLGWADAYEKSMAAAKPPLSELSLTGQLKHDEAPVSQFMAEFLPHSLAVQRDYLRHLAGLPHPVQPIDVQYPNWSALGHTIDYRLRLSFDGTPGPAVELGIALLASTGYLPGAPTSVGRKALIDAGRELRATLGEYLTDPHAVDDHTVTRLCFVASFFENIYRTGRIRRFSMLAEATAATTLDDLVAAVPAYAVDDIDQQLRLAERPLAQFRALPRRAKICGPTFAGSKDVTADADFILGGLLLDCKATREPKGIGREEIHQLAGYLLLDYDDEFGIDHVGLYLSRQGGLITWSVEEFLGRLGATLPLARLRAELRKHLRAARKRDQGR